MTDMWAMIANCIPGEVRSGAVYHNDNDKQKPELEMLGSIVSCLGSVNPQHVCSLCKFNFTCL